MPTYEEPAGCRGGAPCAPGRRSNAIVQPEADGGEKKLPLRERLKGPCRAVTLAAYSLLWKPLPLRVSLAAARPMGIVYLLFMR